MFAIHGVPILPALREERQCEKKVGHIARLRRGAGVLDFPDLAAQRCSMTQRPNEILIWMTRTQATRHRKITTRKGPASGLAKGRTKGPAKRQAKGLTKGLAMGPAKGLARGLAERTS